jgi:hypothetical protein
MPHIHMIVPGGGVSLDGSRWIGRRPDVFLPVRVLPALFRRLMLRKAGRGTFHGGWLAKCSLFRNRMDNDCYE